MLAQSFMTVAALDVSASEIGSRSCSVDIIFSVLQVVMGRRYVFTQASLWESLRVSCIFCVL